MDNETNIPNEEQTGRLQQPAVMPSRLAHPYSAVRCDNVGELHYVLKWAEAKGREVGRWMWEWDEFPFCVYFSTGVKSIGWNDRADRIGDKVSFAEFVRICDWA